MIARQAQMKQHRRQERQRKLKESKESKESKELKEKEAPSSDSSTSTVTAPEKSEVTIRMPKPLPESVTIPSDSSEIIEKHNSLESVEIDSSNLSDSSITEFLSAIPDLPEQVPPSTQLPPSPTEIQGLRDQLVKAQAEITQLKEVLYRSTKDGLTIGIPVPAINSTGILDVTQYEQVKALYSGVIIEMINTVHREMEAKNRQAYSFYRINSESKEIQMTFTVTE